MSTLTLAQCDPPVEKSGLATPCQKSPLVILCRASVVYLELLVAVIVSIETYTKFQLV